MSITTHPAAVTKTVVVASTLVASRQDVAALTELAPTVDRPIGLAVALSQTPSRFIQNAKLTKGAAARSFNALHYS